jgi:peptidoglycan/LPS O-acetylase OafA/YrhL
VLRALAALLVIHAHSVDLAVKHGTPTGQAAFFSLENFGAVGVDVFFVLSGFVVSLSAAHAHSARDFLLRRAIRIFPLYALLTLAFAATARVMGVSVDASFVAQSLLLLPTFTGATLPVIDIGWTLTFEVFFYAVLGALLALPDRRALVARAAVVVAGCILAGAAAHAAVGGGLSLLPGSTVVANPIALEFVFGCLIGIVWQRRRWHGPTLLATGAGLLVSTVFIGFGQISEVQFVLDGSLSWPRLVIWGIPAALLVAGATQLRTEVGSQVGRILVGLGDRSYSIYVSSAITLPLVGLFWPTFAHAGGDAAVLLAMAISTMVGVGCYRYVERPMNLALNRWYAHLAPSQGGNGRRVGPEPPPELRPNPQLILDPQPVATRGSTPTGVRALRPNGNVAVSPASAVDGPSGASAQLRLLPQGDESHDPQTGREAR